MAIGYRYKNLVDWKQSLVGKTFLYKSYYGEPSTKIKVVSTRGNLDEFILSDSGISYHISQLVDQDTMKLIKTNPLIRV